MDMKQAKLNIQHLKISDLKLAEYNPRIITDKEFKGLGKSISSFGLVENIVVNKDMTVIGGHQRIRALREQGYESVDCHVVDLDTKGEKKLNVILNSTKISGKYDELKLSEILEELKLDEDYFDLNLDELEPLDLSAEILPPQEGQDDVPEIKNEPFVVKGDIFEITARGCKYRIGCLDSTSVDEIEKLMCEEKADLFHTDPPYNVNYESKTNGLKILNDNFNSAELFYQFLYDAFLIAATYMKNGGSAYIWHGPSEALNFIKAYTDAGFLYKQEIIWVKNSIVLGRQDYQWQHESALYGWKDGGSHYFADDRSQSTIWECDKPNRSAEHPTMKPIELCEKAIINSSEKGENVLDLFCGSGSTAIACIKTQRDCYTCDISEHYTQVAVKRCVEFFNKNNIEFEITLNGEKFDINKLN
jgi:DNA modification methylase